MSNARKIMEEFFMSPVMYTITDKPVVLFKNALIREAMIDPVVGERIFNEAFNRFNTLRDTWDKVYEYFFKLVEIFTGVPQSH